MKRIILVVLCLLLVGCVTAVDESLPYAELPTITVATAVTLVASPFHPTAYLPSDPISEGETTQVIGMDKDAAWLLVLHEDTLGWIPTIHSRSNVGNLKPAIEIDLLSDRCTKYLGTTNAPDESWISNTNGSAIIQGSIYRPQTGESFQAAALTLQITGGGTVVTADYVHTPLTPSSAIILFTYAVDNLTQASRIAFNLANPGRGPLAFQAAFFSNDCPDEVNGTESGFTDKLPIGELRTVVTNSIPSKAVDVPQSSQSPAILVSSGEPRSAPISSPVESLAWSPDGRFLAAGSQDGVVGIWQIEDGTLLHTLEGHNAAIATLAWSPNSALLASGSKDGTMRVWQVEDGRSLYALKSPQSSKLASTSPGVGVIPFNSPSDPSTLNSVFGWQPGSSQASTYDLEMYPGSLTLIAGPGTNQWDRTDTAPLVAYPHEGNFSTQVKLMFAPEGKHYKVAGLGVRSVQNHLNWLKIIRTLHDTGQGVMVLGGGGLDLNYASYVSDEVFLKIERQGPLFTLSYSTNDVNWIALQKDYVFEISNDVEIFLVVYSTSNEGTVAQFSDFGVTTR